MAVISFSYDRLCKDIAYHLGWGEKPNLSEYTPAQRDRLDRIVQRGWTRFMYPPLLHPPYVSRPQQEAYVWSFLAPERELSIQAKVSSSATSVYNSGITTITASDEIFESWHVGKELTIEDREDSVVIASVSSSTVITVSGDVAWSGSKTVSTLKRPDYLLPIGFGGLRGKPVIKGYAYSSPLEIIGENQIRAMRERHNVSGMPRFCSIIPTAETSTSNNRWELMIWPQPDNDYTLIYRCNVDADARASDVFSHILGGVPYYEAVLEACLSVADVTETDQLSVHEELFLRALATAESIDRNMSTPDTLGIMGESTTELVRIRRHEGDHLVIPS